MEVGKGWKMETESDLAWNNGCTMQCAEVLVSCTLETYMVL